MISKTLCVSLFAVALALGANGAAFAQTSPNSNNNSTQGAPSGSSSGNSATGSGAAPSGK